MVRRVRRRRLGVALVIASSLLLALPAASAALPTSRAAPAATKVQPGLGVLVQECDATVGKKRNTAEAAACRTLQAFTSSIAALCRMPTRPLSNSFFVDECSLADGRLISEQQIAKFRRSWTYRALGLQRRLYWAAPLYEAQFPGTHNSFNASSYDSPLRPGPTEYYPTLTNQDPNQVYSITDQLRMGIRGLEVDLHWVPSIYGNLSTAGYWVDVCHGQSTLIPATKLTVHIGCTIDRSLQSTLAEIREWLQQHRKQVVLLYLENQLDSKLQAHDIAASLIKRELGDLVYRPRHNLKPGQCAQMPYATSEADLARRHKQVLLVGNCGPGAWNKWVFTRGNKWNEGGDPSNYNHADCVADRTARESHSVFRRWYEESPLLEALMNATQVLTANATRRMVRCGVNLTGWDQLIPTDGRLQAFIWSWAKGQPHAPGRCAYQGADGRFRAGDCAVRRHYACVGAHFDWHVTSAVGPGRLGSPVCHREFPGSHFGVPPNGLRNWQLRTAKPKPRDTVWLRYRKLDGTWRVPPRKRGLG